MSGRTKRGNVIARNAILSRVRKALSIESDPHVRNAAAKPAKENADNANGELPLLNSNRVESFLPFVGESIDEQAALFTELSEKLQTDFRVVTSLDNALEAVKQIAKENGWNRVATHKHELATPAATSLHLPVLYTDDRYDVEELEKCDAGISGCEALIAQTASVLITDQSSGGRALSVLPPHHVVLASAEQMLPTLASGYRLLTERYGDQIPRFVSAITGPSRTADVERVLVLGAHGPKKLTIIMIL